MWYSFCCNDAADDDDAVASTADDAWKKLLELSNSREVDIGSTEWPWQCTEFCDVFVWPDILFFYLFLVTGAL